MLVVGDHSIQFMYADGASNAGSFTVRPAKTDSVIPITGDGPLCSTAVVKCHKKMDYPKEKSSP